MRSCDARSSRHLETYDDNAHVQRALADAVVSRLAARCRKNVLGRVLDLGCGTGLLTRRFLRDFSCGELFLYDLVPECGQFVSDIPRSRFFSLDLNAPGLLPPADVLLSGACCQWLEEPRVLFRAAAKSLPSGGWFAGSSFAAGNLEELALCGGTPLVCPAAETWRVLLTECGFVPEDFACFTETLYFPSPADTLRHLKKTGVLISALKNCAEVRHFLDRYEKLRRPGRGIPLTYRPVLWVARKA